MKINIIATLLFALKASTVSGFAISGPCKEFDIQTEQDCNDHCKDISGGNWKGSVSGPADEITECMCTFSASKEAIENGLPATNVFTCTRKPTPEKTVRKTESCETPGIETWDDCVDNCKSLANGRRYFARVEGGKGNISACYCTYGPNLENSYTCKRTPPPLPPFPEKRTPSKCNAYDINNEEECFAFCTKYKRWAKYVGNANGPVRCDCQDVQGGPSVWYCKGEGSDSYLRSS
jgi:hypothetical protein